ncbi:MAG: SDR family oxidoreductase [Betaproteobacteria bacterium]|nr:MAG: SDR family oxidoreductase [Betaproteobacteria bacterium]
MAAENSSAPDLVKSLHGKCAIVTGGGRGIGRAVALEFARLGVCVHIVSRSDNAIQVAQDIVATGGRAHGHVGSVANESFARSVIEEIVSRDGQVDILVNAAAIIGPWGRFSEGSMSAFIDVLNVNLVGACNFIRWTLGGMERAGFGRIINFAGGGAAYSYPMFSPYGASKAALVRMTEIIGDEIQAPNVTINIIAPGAVDTDMLAEIRRYGGEVRTLVDISEPVRLVTFLAGPDSAHINGRFIHSRDDWRDIGLFDTPDLLKLRRTEKR